MTAMRKTESGSLMEILVFLGLKPWKQMLPWALDLPKGAKTGWPRCATCSTKERSRSRHLHVVSSAPTSTSAEEAPPSITIRQPKARSGTIALLALLHLGRCSRASIASRI
eukprot:6917044-Pyramimonas_sp.AAC.1